MPVQADFDAGDFADHLAAMSDGELFEPCSRLKTKSEEVRREQSNGSEVVAKIAVVEPAIGDRFPGLCLAPYKDWQQRRTDI